MKRLQLSDVRRLQHVYMPPDMQMFSTSLIAGLVRVGSHDQRNQQYSNVMGHTDEASPHYL